MFYFYVIYNGHKINLNVIVALPAWQAFEKEGGIGNSSAREREGHPRVHARPNSSFIFPLERLPRMLIFRCSLLNHCYSY